MGDFAFFKTFFIYRIYFQKVKEHFIVKVKEDFKLPVQDGIPYWKNFVLDKSIAVEHFFPDFDNILKENSLKFWLTREYDSSSPDKWSSQEKITGLDRIYRVILQQDYTYPENLVNKIQLLKPVEDIRGIEIGEAVIPQPVLSTQTSFGQISANELIHLNFAKAFSKGSPEIKIAVLDTGVNLDHRELKGKILKRADFVNLEGLNTAQFIGDFKEYDDIPEDEVGHGTHVSGIIAASGIKMDEGVCPQCSLMAVRVLASMKSGNKVVGAGIIDNINAGIKWAVDQGADIINMSLGIKHSGGGLPHQEVIKYALSKNVTIVAASGNDGTEEKYYPGALPGVIAVGAVDTEGAVTNFTSFGANITVIAPGLNIYSSYTNNEYAYASGTSQASPFVCGAIGLMKSFALQKGKKLTNDEVLHILRNTSDKIDNRLRNPKAGYGLINLADAFKLLNYQLN